jgi:hypothetical protein
MRLTLAPMILALRVEMNRHDMEWDYGKRFCPDFFLAKSLHPFYGSPIGYVTPLRTK